MIDNDKFHKPALSRKFYNAAGQLYKNGKKTGNDLTAGYSLDERNAFD